MCKGDKSVVMKRERGSGSWGLGAEGAGGCGGGGRFSSFSAKKPT